MLEEVTNVTFDECVKRNFVKGEDEISITRIHRRCWTPNCFSD